MNGTTFDPNFTQTTQELIRFQTTPQPNSAQTFVSILIPATIVPIVFFIVLFLICIWIKLSGNQQRPRKPSTYEDFSRVDNTEMLRMSVDITLEEEKAE